MKWCKRDPFAWKQWFAWCPVVIADQWVWFETVERRWATSHSRRYDYRLITKE